MPNNLTDYEENRLLDLSWLVTDKLALVSALGTDSAAGTEVTGGSYARQTTADLASAASGSKTNNGAGLSFSAMPTTDVQGWEIWDSAGTNRKWWGPFSRKLGTAQATGDTITITAHGYSDGGKIVFQAGYVPAGLAASTTYFVRDSATDTFKVAATLGGSAINITADAALVVVGRVADLNSGDDFDVAPGQIVLSLQ